MATVVVGGLASTLLLTFLALPSLCYLMKRKSESAKFADKCFDRQDRLGIAETA